MRKPLVLLAIVLLPILATACKRDVPQSHLTDLPDVSALPADMGATAEVAVGEIVETMDSGGYTYVQIDTGTEKLWAASTACEVKVGDKIGISKAQPMPNWHSKTLERDFDMVYFVNAFLKPDGTSISAGGHGTMGTMASGSTGRSNSAEG